MRVFIKGRRNRYTDTRRWLLKDVKSRCHRASLLETDNIPSDRRGPRKRGGSASSLSTKGCRAGEKNQSKGATRKHPTGGRRGKGR